jgi:hypothetical protein
LEKRPIALKGRLIIALLAFFGSSEVQSVEHFGYPAPGKAQVLLGERALDAGYVSPAPMVCSLDDIVDVLGRIVLAATSFPLPDGPASKRWRLDFVHSAISFIILVE